LRREARAVERQQLKSERERERLARDEQRSREKMERIRVVYQYDVTGNPQDPGSSFGAWVHGAFMLGVWSVIGTAGGVVGGFYGLVVGQVLTHPYSSVPGAFGLVGLVVPTVLGVARGIYSCSVVLSNHRQRLEDYERRRRGDWW
jgi:hypothetical protein